MGRLAYSLILVAWTAAAQPYELPPALQGSGDAEALIDFAAQAEERGDWDLAADALQEIPEPDADTRVRLATALYRSGPAGKPEAFRVAREVLDGAEQPQARFLLGLLYLEQDLAELARECFAAARAATEETDALHTPLTVVEAALAVRAGAVVEAESKLAALGQAAAAYDVETRDLLRRAVQVFERDRRVFPDTAEHHDAWAHLLYRAGRIPDAIRAARRSLQLDEENADNWTFLGAMQAQIGQFEEAIAAYERALELDPDNDSLRQALERMRG